MGSHGNLVEMSKKEGRTQWLNLDSHLFSDLTTFMFYSDILNETVHGLTGGSFLETTVLLFN